jgi:hypothetical protein
MAAPQSKEHFTTEATEVTDSRRRKHRAQQIRKRDLYPRRQKCFVSVVPVRSVVNLFFAAAESVILFAIPPRSAKS